jgi:aldehyde:ferredoxin oxidoreductase
MIAGKSPLTGTWGDANCGGYFGPEIKKCGYDAILIKGAAKTPKYVAIIDGEKKLMDATDLWGLDTVETEEKLVEKHEKARIASIGQSGEKLSLISGVVNDKGRIAARSGFGAVLGSKKLKALVLKGTDKLPIVDNSKLVELAKEYNEGIKEATSGATFMWKSFGTSWMNDIVAKTGDAPIKNWKGTHKEDFPPDQLKKLTGMEVNKFKEKEFGCFACSVRCGGIVKMEDAGLEESHQPEYETCAAFGHLLLNDDLQSIFKINDMCNRAGIDTISVGGTVGYAIEAFENGVISKDDTDGLELSWGNAEAIIGLVDKIIKREGIGDILADGTQKAVEKFNEGSKEYAINSMGQELGMHSPKYYKSLGMSYAFDPTPGRHTAASLDMLVGGPMMKPNGLFEGFALPRKFKRSGEDRWEAHKLVISMWQSTCSLGMCQFIYFFQKYPLIELIKALTGWDITIEEILTIGQRIQTLRQAFTLREGINIAENEIPERTVGIDYKEEYQGYCEKMGWNPENGHPLKETLDNLNLGFVKKDLY